MQVLTSNTPLPSKLTDNRAQASKFESLESSTQRNHIIIIKCKMQYERSTEKQHSIIYYFYTTKIRVVFSIYQEAILNLVNATITYILFKWQQNNCGQNRENLNCVQYCVRIANNQ